MARARNIKPAFFHDADLLDLPVQTRMLFAGLWCYADREGRLIDHPKQIKLDIFPADDFPVDDMLSSLAARGFIQRYAADGKKLIQIRNFSKHQNPHVREPQSSLPGPDEAKTGEHSASTVPAPDKHGAGPADSLKRIPDSPIQVGEVAEISTVPPGATAAGLLAAALLKAGVQVTSQNPILRRWVADEIGAERLLAAVADIRARDNAPDTIRAGYLDRVVRDEAPRVNGNHGPPWWSSEQLMLAKARELGVHPRAGEDWQALRQRINARMVEQQRGAH